MLTAAFERLPPVHVLAFRLLLCRAVSVRSVLRQTAAEAHVVSATALHLVSLSNSELSCLLTPSGAGGLSSIIARRHSDCAL